jgi:hypothetical protein
MSGRVSPCDRWMSLRKASACVIALAQSSPQEEFRVMDASVCLRVVGRVRVGTGNVSAYISRTVDGFCM